MTVNSDLACAVLVPERLDADAAAVVHSATGAVKAILARREALDREGQQDKPLVVIAGENHDAPAHKLHHMLVLNRLLEQGEKPVLGCEFPHNYLSWNFFETTRWRYDNSLAARIEKKDRNGIYARKCYTGFFNSPYAPVSYLAFFRFLDRAGLTTRFTDIAKNRQECLNSGDLSTRESIKTCLGKMPASIKPVSRDGLFVRNHHMTKVMTDFISETNARIAVHLGGNNHIFDTSSPVEESLPALFKMSALPLLALSIVSPFSTPNCFSDNILMEQETHLCSGLPEISVNYRYDKPLQANYLNETAYINALSERTGMDRFCESLEDSRNEQRHAKREMIQIFHRFDSSLRKLRVSSKLKI